MKTKLVWAYYSLPCITIKAGLTDPSPVQVDGYKGRWNGEVIHEGVELQHEPELVWGCDEPDKVVEHEEYIEVEPDEEVDHKEYVESEVNLLGGVLHPGNTSLHAVAGKKLLGLVWSDLIFLLSVGVLGWFVNQV